MVLLTENAYSFELAASMKIFCVCYNKLTEACDLICYLLLGLALSWLNPENKCYIIDTGLKT
jgi:hypothetical protein